ncbi:Glucosamine-6-phosphate isomerase (Glucosamine-6-phosphate deaminase) (GNPDA) (GlcN6P deaminase) [Lithohypha guttulata]|uniref:Glucosamine-6-phosphate isomerase n=1 Tax=Lithohypha guttulata TaxID=1690604 RepID=A0AAN7Y8L6_9EURO|nr:Glucosamine-6-phosphate isomerase (Glucosamine-6-phosphate deaminase) (GNPDA) (GlcN6P deaminase) [Lithohypha guttulata]
MKLIIRDDAESASEYVAQYMIKRINDFAPTPERPFVLGLPTGSSPEKIYKYLVEAYKNDNISFANVVTFNMDEYVDLAEDHPESYHSFMYKHFFAHVDVKPENVHLLNGNAPDLLVECAEYERKIREAGGIELFLGGIGPDGHIAFNEPGSSLRSRTRVAILAEDTIRANSRFFDNDISQVPKQALSVGVGTVMDAREVVLIVTGHNKAVALQKVVEGSVSQMWTASCLQMHENAIIACDDAATDEMLVKNARYFKSIERVEVEQIERKGRATVAATSEDSRSYQWRGALKKLQVDTDGANKKTHKAENGELTPDSMHGRLMDSAIGMDDIEKMEDGMKLTNMGSRVNTIEV